MELPLTAAKSITNNLIRMISNDAKKMKNRLFLVLFSK